MTRWPEARPWLAVAPLFLASCQVVIGGDDLVFTDGGGGAATAASSGATGTSGPGTSTAVVGPGGGDAASTGGGTSDGGGGSTDTSAGGAGGGEPVCGDGTVENGEACEDDNTITGDSCGECQQIVQVTYHGGHGCVRISDGRVKCWGPNGGGQLGQSDTTTRGDNPGELGPTLPAVDLGPGRTAVDVSAGKFSTCVVRDDRSVVCWGSNEEGQLGIGSKETRGDTPGEMGRDLVPVDLGTDRTALKVVIGEHHACAILDQGDLKCWGSGFWGNLGQGNDEDLGDEPGEMGDDLPPIDLGTGMTVKAVAVGNFHTCAILDTDKVKCFGGYSSGQIGLETDASIGDVDREMGSSLPYVDLGTDRTVKAIAAGYAHTCAILDDDRVKCWGNFLDGRLGGSFADDRGDQTGEMGDDLPHVDLGSGRRAKTIAAGFDHTCAILDDDTLKCWGDSQSGELGLGAVEDEGDVEGDMGDDLASVSLGTGRFAQQIAAGTNVSCALLDDATVKCWGTNGVAQLGLGDLETRGDGQGEMGDDLPTLFLP